MRPRLALIAGEPAGIGPELVVRAAQQDWDAELVVFGDAASLLRAADALGLPLHLHRHGEAATQPRSLAIVDIPHPVATRFGHPDPANTASLIAAMMRTLRIVDTALRTQFGLAVPTIAVLGLNPHAGEDGHLGREELDIIIPSLDHLRGEGLRLVGPLPADTAFLPNKLQGFDAVLAMYHDQGLPVLKHADFAHAVNITLGLPYPRVAVDHGTALELAGQGTADPSSLYAAIRTCTQLAAQRKRG